MSWNNMSEQERYYRRLNSERTSEDMAGFGALALILAAIGLILYAGYGVILFIGNYFVQISCICGAIIGLAEAKKIPKEDSSGSTFNYIFFLIVYGLIFGGISFGIKSWLFNDIGNTFSEFISSWGL